MEVVIAEAVAAAAIVVVEQAVLMLCFEIVVNQMCTPSLGHAHLIFKLDLFLVFPRRVFYDQIFGSVTSDWASFCLVIQCRMPQRIGIPPAPLKSMASFGNKIVLVVAYKKGNYSFW